MLLGMKSIKLISKQHIRLTSTMWGQKCQLSSLYLLHSLLNFWHASPASKLETRTGLFAFLVSWKIFSNFDHKYCQYSDWKVRQKASTKLSVLQVTTWQLYSKTKYMFTVLWSGYELELSVEITPKPHVSLNPDTAVILLPLKVLIEQCS